MDKPAKKGRKSYYKSPASRSVFHLGLELPIELKEPFKKLAASNDRKMKSQAIHIIKLEIEKFQRQAESPAQMV